MDHPNPHKEHNEILKELKESLKEDVDRGLKLLDSCVTQIAQARWILTNVNSTVEDFTREKDCPVCIKIKSNAKSQSAPKKLSNCSPSPSPTGSKTTVPVSQKSSSFDPPKKNASYKAGPLSKMRPNPTDPIIPIVPTPVSEPLKPTRKLAIIVEQTMIRIPLLDIKSLLHGQPTTGILLSEIDTSALTSNLPERPRNLTFRPVPVKKEKPLISKVSGNMKNKPAGLASKRFLESLAQGKKYLTPAIIESDSDSSSVSSKSGKSGASKSKPESEPKEELPQISKPPLNSLASKRKASHSDDDSSDSDFVKPKSQLLNKIKPNKKPISKKSSLKYHKISDSSDSEELPSISDSSDDDSDENERMRRTMIKKKANNPNLKKPLSTKMKITIKDDKVVKSAPASSATSQPPISSSKKDKKDKDKDKDHHRHRSNSVTSSSHSHSHSKKDKDKHKDKDKERKSSTDSHSNSSKKKKDKDRSHSHSSDKKHNHKSERDNSISKMASNSKHVQVRDEFKKRKRSSSVDSSTTEFTDLTKKENNLGIGGSEMGNPLFDTLLKKSKDEGAAPIKSKTMDEVPKIIQQENSNSNATSVSSSSGIDKSESNSKPKYKPGPASRSNIKSSPNLPETSKPKPPEIINLLLDNLDSKSDTGKSELSTTSSINGGPATSSITSTMSAMKRKISGDGETGDVDGQPAAKKSLGLDKKEQLRAKLAADPELRKKLALAAALKKKKMLEAQKAKSTETTPATNGNAPPPAPKSTISEAKSFASSIKEEPDDAIEPGDDIIGKCLEMANIDDPESPPPRFEIRAPPDLQDCISPTGVSKFFGTNRLSTDSIENLVTEPEPLLDRETLIKRIQQSLLNSCSNLIQEVGCLNQIQYQFGSLFSKCPLGKETEETERNDLMIGTWYYIANKSCFGTASSRSSITIFELDKMELVHLRKAEEGLRKFI